MTQHEPNQISFARRASLQIGLAKAGATVYATGRTVAEDTFPMNRMNMETHDSARTKPDQFCPACIPSDCRSRLARQSPSPRTHILDLTPVDSDVHCTADHYAPHRQTTPVPQSSALCRRFDHCPRPSPSPHPHIVYTRWRRIAPQHAPGERK